jgi:hypothetical protein
MADIEEKLKKMSLAELNETNNEILANSSKYEINVSNLNLNKTAKESTIYQVLTKVKSENELKENLKKLIETQDRPYNLQFTKNFLFLPFGEFLFGSFILILYYKKKLNLNSFGFLSCAFAITNEFAKNSFYNTHFKNEFQIYLSTKKNYDKLINHFISEMSIASIFDFYSKQDHMNVRDELALEVINPIREEVFDKELFQELMYAFDMMIK